MNRDQFELLLEEKLDECNTHSVPSPIAPWQLADRLWPVLAQVWADGYIEGASDVMDGRLYSSNKTPNPYSGSPA